jgi:uncharacterized membrane protein
MAMRLGDRVADAMNRVMGSWPFVIGLAAFLTGWFAWNILAPAGLRFDAQPFFYLNLFMSTMATFTAPILLLASNRQAAKDRESLEDARDDSAEDLALDTKALDLITKIAGKLEIE